MQNWQKDRNYRKYENIDGTFTYVITIDGMDIEVSAEVFKAYSQGDRRERYLVERDAGWLLPFDHVNDCSISLSPKTDRHAESAEDEAIKKILTEQAVEALALLGTDECQLIQAVVMDGVLE